MQCTHPYTVPGVGKVPCGRCTGCKIARSREWAMRLVHENGVWAESVFATLTYSDDYLPTDLSLSKRHLQLFVKRLRKDIKLKKIRYFACGEYGDKNGRPHYHAIIYGLGPENYDQINDAWSQGLVHCGSVTYQSARYVAKYVFKRYDPRYATQVYGERQQPFVLMSHSLGKTWAEENKKYITDNEVITLNGVKMSTPRYYRKILNIKMSDEELNMRAVDRATKSEEVMRKRKIDRLDEVEYRRKIAEQRDEENRSRETINDARKL